MPLVCTVQRTCTAWRCAICHEHQSTDSAQYLRPELAGVVSSVPGGSTGEGHTIWTTPASALDVQMFYYLNLPGDGWTPVAQMAGQYAEQFTGSENSSGRSAVGALEFTRRRDAEHVRIVTEPVGYSVWLDCHD